MDYDPIPLLENAGYTQQEASFLYLVAMHSGYFLRRQFCRFLARDRGKLAHSFLKKGRRLDHLRVIECGQSRHVYHLASQSVYLAVLRKDSQHRRFKGYDYMHSRLLILDFVLDNLARTILEEESAKIAFFTTQCGIPAQKLPHGGVAGRQLFPDGFPVFVSSNGTPQFTFFEDGSVTLSRFERYLDRYRSLFSALDAFELVYLSETGKSFSCARAAFASRFTETQIAGVTQQTPLGVDHFLRFLEARKKSEAGNHGIHAGDGRILREGEAIYSALEHRALYAAWKTGGTNAAKIRQRFIASGPLAKFTALRLPYTYPLFHMKHEKQTNENQRSRLGSPQRSLFEEH